MLETIKWDNAVLKDDYILPLSSLHVSENVDDPNIIYPNLDINTVYMVLRQK